MIPDLGSLSSFFEAEGKKEGARGVLEMLELSTLTQMRANASHRDERRGQ